MFGFWFGLGIVGLGTPFIGVLWGLFDRTTRTWSFPIVAPLAVGAVAVIDWSTDWHNGLTWGFSLTVFPLTAVFWLIGFIIAWAMKL